MVAMLDNERREKLADDWSKRIDVAEIRAAFEHFVVIASRLQDFDSYIQQKGDGREFRFYETSTHDQPFSFSTHPAWLMFCFREAAVRSTAYSLRELQAVFSGARENERGEWTVRVRSVEDVDKLVRFIGWHYILDANSMS
jgi:hypothetical protein